MRRFDPEAGIVSFYHEPQKLVTGGRFDPEQMIAAHRTWPLGSVVRCTRLDTGRSVIVVIHDRGPHIAGRILDLSRGAARQLQLKKEGITRCRVELLAYPQGSAS